VAVFEGADDARHLGRQDAEQALDIAHDHGAVGMQDGQGEELDFLEVAVAAAPQGGQANLRYHFKQVPGDVFDPVSGADGHGFSPSPYSASADHSIITVDMWLSTVT